MSVTYRLIQRPNARNPDAPKKYYPVVKSRGRCELHHLAAQIAEVSTLSSADMYGALEALLQIIPEELLNGNIVDLGDFGSFSVSLRSSGVEDPAKFSGKRDSRVRVNFRPGQRFKEQLDEVELEKLPE